ncbi:MAG: glycine cleavage system protein GcvH [Anaerolineae bacterium]|nr:glycine cleavage system protein GcvH [Anaerolineae bacterium]
MKLDKDARYQETHEWARKVGALIVVGISDHAQSSLSDIVFVELPEVGATVAKGDAFGVVESVKAAADVYVPMSGTVVAVNTDLEDSPANVNEDPFEAGWLIKIEPSDPAEWDGLMDAAAYEAMVAAEK